MVFLLVAVALVCGEDDPEAVVTDLGRLPPGLKIPRRAPRVAMETINAMNRILPPQPVPWPPGFSATFVTNVSKAEAEADGAWGHNAVKGRYVCPACAPSTAIKVSSALDPDPPTPPTHPRRL